MMTSQQATSAVLPANVRPLTTRDHRHEARTAARSVVKVVRVDRDARADVSPRPAGRRRPRRTGPAAAESGAPARTSDPACSGCGGPACPPARCSRSARRAARERVSSNRSPLIEHMPATTPSPGVFLRSASIELRWCWRATTSGQYSLNEPGIDEAVDVLARHSVAGLAPPGDRLGPVLVQRQGVPLEVFAQVVADVIEVDLCGGGDDAARRPRPAR